MHQMSVSKEGVYTLRCNANHGACGAVVFSTQLDKGTALLFQSRDYMQSKGFSKKLGALIRRHCKHLKEADGTYNLKCEKHRGCKMKYRDHKGGYEESMQTEREVYSLDELEEYLTNKYKKIVAEIRYSSPIFDPRNGWDTRIVSMRFEGEQNFHVAGMSDGELK